MAFEQKIRYSGQNRTDVLSGRIRLEEGNNRMVITEGDVEMLVITKDGIVLNDGSTNRMIIGVLPNGNIGIIIVKEGADAFAVFN